MSTLTAVKVRGPLLSDVGWWLAHPNVLLNYNPLHGWWLDKGISWVNSNSWKRMMYHDVPPKVGKGKLIKRREKEGSIVIS